MENTTSFPIEKDDNKSHSIVDVPSVKKEDNNFAIKLWADSVNKLRNMASPRALGMCLIIITTRFGFFDYYVKIRHTVSPGICKISFHI